MADSNSQPPLCPCGFWGSAQTQGLCSKCYKEHQQKVDQANSASGNSTSSLSASAITKAFDEVKPLSSQDFAASSTGATSDTTEPSLPSSSNGSGTSDMLDTDTSSLNDRGEANGQKNKDSADIGPPSKEPSPGSKREREETLDPERPVQKNKKRCFKCNCKLELALREIGRCRCDYIFCPLHRLPEQHDCMFDHKEKGRQEARDKMISPKKHMGTSLKRIDSDS